MGASLLSFDGRILASNNSVCELFGVKPDVVLSNASFLLTTRICHVWDLLEKWDLGPALWHSASKDAEPGPSDASAGFFPESWSVEAIAIWDAPQTHGRGFVLFCHDR